MLLYKGLICMFLSPSRGEVGSTRVVCGVAMHSGGGCLATSALRVGPSPPTPCVCTWGPFPHTRTARAGPAEAQTVTRTHKHTHTAAENGVLQTRPSPLRESGGPSGPPPRPRPLTRSVRPRSAGWAR